MFFLGASLLVLVIVFVIHLCRNSKRNMQMNNLKLKDCEAILNNTHDAIFLVDVIYDQEVIFKLKRLNTTYERLTGFREEELIGKSPEEILVEEESEIVKSRYVKCMQKGETISYEETLELPKGKKTWHTKLTPVFDGNNRVIQLIGSSRDITKMKQAEKNIKVSENKFKQIYEDNPVGLIKSDPEGNILDLNKKMLQILNAPGKDEVVGMSFKRIEATKDIWPENPDFFKKGKVLSGEICYTSRWRKYIWISYSVKPIITDDSISELLVVCNDITDLKENERKLKYLSFKDELTDLYNRRYFTNELDRLNSSREIPISIIVGDLDKLKFINDSYGHEIGDDYIKKAAELLSSCLRKSDIISRMGGDEFAILLPNTDLKTTKRIYNRIKDRFREEKLHNDIKMSISLGLAVKKDEATDLKEVYIEADHNMYQEKNRQY